MKYFLMFILLSQMCYAGFGVSVNQEGLAVVNGNSFSSFRIENTEFNQKFELQPYEIKEFKAKGKVRVYSDSMEVVEVNVKKEKRSIMPFLILNSIGIILGVVIWKKKSF